jgi:bacteriocin biosynthesis cyclodehydratase domain-containing protein
MQTPRLVLLTVGGFGAAVGSGLAARYPQSVVIDATAGTYLSAWPALDALVLVADHDDPALAEMVERAAFAWCRPWLPVVLEHASLRCGPVVTPGRSACLACFRRRRRQHAVDASVWADPPGTAVIGDRVTGWAHHHAGLAVALATAAIGDAFEENPAPPGAWVRTVGLADGSVGRAGVVPVDGCARCGNAAARAARQDRLVVTLSAALSDSPVRREKEPIHG